MKTNHTSFTLIELLIAMAISSFVMMGMMQGQRNVMRFLNSSRNLMAINRKVCLLFNQMERDFSSAFIPVLAETVAMEEADRKGDRKKKKSKIQKEPENKRAKNSYFFSTIQEDAGVRIEGKKYQLLNRVSFITSHPLQLFGQRRVRLVRVGYELQIDRARKEQGRLVYLLIRKETTVLSNADFKVHEPEEGKQQETIRTHVVANDVRDVFIEYVMPKAKKKDEETQTPEEEMIASFTWGDKKELKNVLPQYVRLRVTLWNKDLTRDYSFECVIPVLAYTKQVQQPEKKVDPSIQSSSAKASSDHSG